jgi:hypothetical protein
MHHVGSCETVFRQRPLFQCFTLQKSRCFSKNGSHAVTAENNGPLSAGVWADPGSPSGFWADDNERWAI